MTKTSHSVTFSMVLTTLVLFILQSSFSFGQTGQTEQASMFRFGNPMVRISGTQIVTVRPIQFQTQSDTLLPQSQTVLEHLRELLQSTPSIGRIRIEYHNECSADVGDGLALRRAQKIRQWLVNHGIASSRIEAQAVSHGQNDIERQCPPERRNITIWIVG